MVYRVYSYEALIDNFRGEAEEVVISAEGMHDYGGILNIL